MAATKLNGGFLRNAVISRIAKAKQDEEAEFEELKSYLRKNEVAEMQEWLIESLTNDSKSFQLDAKVDPLLVIDAFVKILDDDILQIRRHQKLVKRYLLPTIAKIEDFSSLPTA